MLQLRLYLFTVLFSLLFSCGSNDKNTESFQNTSELNKYQDYIAQVSSGVVSAFDPVNVILQQPVQGWDTDQLLDKEILKVSPKTKGKLIALNNRTLSFQPEIPFEADTKYEFTLDLDALNIDVESDLDEEFIFKIKTIKQQFSVSTQSLQSYNKSWQYIDGAIRTNDLMELTTATKLISAIQKKKNISVSFSEINKRGKEFSFRIDSIQRFEDDSQLDIQWSGKGFNIDTEGKTFIRIPGKNNFIVTGVTVANTEDQHVEIQFSDPLKKGQNFDGLVTLKGASKLKFTANGQTLKVYPKKELKGALQLTVFEGIKSSDNYKLKTEYSEKITFQQPKPEVRLLQSGAILPTSDNLKFNFEAINLKAVEVTVYKIYQNNILQFLQDNNLSSKGNLQRVGRPIAKKLVPLNTNTSLNLKKWNAFAIDLNKLITPDIGAIYRIQLNYKKAYSLYKCEGETSSNKLAEEEIDFDNEISEESSWDDSENYYDYDWNERDNPCSNSYFRNKKVAANILASNIGVIVKKGQNNSYKIVVNDIITTQPISNANVSFYNYQQQEIASVNTNEKGIANSKNKSSAFFAIVTSGNQKTYVKLNDGNALSVSKFDVSGVRLHKGIKGYMYGERGVWRPGDTLFISFMLNDNANKLPENHPISFELKDPYGKIVHKEIKTESIGNLYPFSFSTSDEAPTGNWLAQIKVGGASFSKQIKIETIKPNRLKIKTSFNDEVLKTNTAIKGNLDVLWLHGAVAKSLKTDINVRFRPTQTSFKTFPGYTFDDPSRKFRAEEQEVFSGNLSEAGKAQFNFSPALEKQAAGMLKASFITKVYENGGDFSTDVISKDFSPYETYIGLNTPKGDKARGMLLTDTQHTFEVVSVDQNGRPKATKQLEVYVYKVNWRWWWDTSEDNLSSYNRSDYRNEVFKTKLSTNSSGKATFNFSLKYPEWGRYLVRVVDPNGGHATGKTIYIDWPGWAGKSKKKDPSAATMLLFSTDKESYNTGDMATITFPSSETGRALVSIENGTEVLDAFWVDSQKGETKFELPILKEYTPNVYIHITLLQPHASTANDLPIRLYGVTPISVENPETRIIPKISMPDVLKPEETISLTISETNNKAMTYSIAIVDEGLLDLTRFSTPDPWNTFYAREALGVKTWDVYDDIIGAYGGSIEQIFSIGGDAEAAGGKSKKANRFKPMVIYQGPFQLKKGNSKTHKIKIPKYIGSVRTMVIASDVDNAAYGKAEKTTPVRKPLMVLSSIPRKITPGEKVTIPVTVFAMEPKVKNVSVSLMQNEGFKIIGEATKKLSFSQPDEQMIYFTIEVLEGVSSTDIKVRANGNGEKASYDVPINIFNPNPITTEVTSLVLEPNGSQQIDWSAFGIKDSNTATIEFSSLPAMNFEGRLKYLIQYPHGCVEQTTSSVFPQLYLSDIFDVTGEKNTKIQYNINAGIDRLKRFIQPNGGLSYWPGNRDTNDWGTTYAGHFLLEANKKGYVLPIGFKSGWINYQQNTAKNWRSGDSDVAQAYRLYTLALANSPDVSSMNRLREKSKLSNDAKLRLAAAYGIIGQQNAGEALLNSANIDFQARSNYSYRYYGSANRNKAMALETLIHLNKRDKAQKLAIQLANELSTKKWMSTQTTAYCLMAMAKYAAYVGGKGIDLQYSLNSPQVSIKTAKTIASSGDLKINKNNTLTVKNNKDNTIFIQIATSGILPIGEEKIVQSNLKAVVDYKSKDGKIIDVTQLSQGTDFVAEVTITNTTSNNLKDLALSEIFPSGWEIVNTRFTDFGEFKANNVTYTDIRDDRVNFYFDLDSKKSKTMTLLLNASYLGKYYLPGIQCEAMYDNEYLVRNKGKWIQVVK